MAKGDDHLQKKKSKVIRKRRRRAGGDSLEAIQGVQAAKRRRKSGTRRACEGMCFTLPTPEDPFNDRNDRKAKRKENRELRSKRVSHGQILEFEADEDVADALAEHKEKFAKRQLKNETKQLHFRSPETLKAVENPVASKEETNVDLQFGNKSTKPLSEENVVEADLVLRRVKSFVKKFEDHPTDSAENTVGNTTSEAELLRDTYMSMTSGGWKERAKQNGSSLGQQCWEAFAKGQDMIASSSSNLQETAADCAILAAVHIKQRQRQQNSLRKPVVLIIVASREAASQMRQVHVPLKETMAISSVCVHAGTSIRNQIEGFRSWSPDIVIATPERLLELAQLHAVQLSSVSFLVIHNLDNIVSKGFGEHLTKLKTYVARRSQTLIVSNRFFRDAVMIVRDLVKEPIVRIVSDSTVERRSACIIQEVSMFTSIAKALPKLIQVLKRSWEKSGEGIASANLVIVKNAEIGEELLPVIGSIGFVTAGLFEKKDFKLKASIKKKIREGIVQVLVTTGEFLNEIPLNSMQLVINHSFPPCLEAYQGILTGMARHSVHGELHSFCTPNIAHIASDFVAFLQSCSEEPPRSLQMLVDAVCLVQNEKRIS